MSEGRSQSRRSLTGVWEGVYSYPAGRLPTVPFTATLIEAGSSLSGSVHEQCTVNGGMLLFSLSGSMRGATISFAKTFVGSSRDYGLILYEGMINDDATEIEGRWTIPRDWSGRFLMTRSGGAPRAAADSRSEEAGLEAIGPVPASR
jgi:hypothetical protein